MYSLDGRNAIVTGGGNGIGRSIALRLADEGCDVAILDMDEAGARKTAADIEGKGRQAHGLLARQEGRRSLQRLLRDEVCRRRAHAEPCPGRWPNMELPRRDCRYEDAAG